MNVDKIVMALRAQEEKHRNDFVLTGDVRISDMARDCADMIESQSAEIARLQQWVNDLQSGMYVNCVYCGHRYGPEKGTPVSMADILKAHIEQCHEHPMSKLKAQLAEYEATGLTPGDIKDLQGLCKENGLSEYVDLIVEAKRQMSKANEQSIEQDERIEQLEAQLAESQRRAQAAVEDFEEYMLDSDDTPCGYCAHYAADKTCHPIKGPCNPKWKGRRGPQEAGKGERNDQTLRELRVLLRPEPAIRFEAVHPRLQNPYQLKRL